MIGNGFYKHNENSMRNKTVVNDNSDNDDSVVFGIKKIVIITMTLINK